LPWGLVAAFNFFLKLMWSSIVGLGMLREINIFPEASFFLEVLVSANDQF